MIHNCDCFGFLKVYFCSQVVFDVGYVILYYLVIGLVGKVMICEGWMCEVKMCGEVWRVLVRMICVVWGVMWQCGLGLMGAML